MAKFPIHTFTIVNSEDQSILHSPALPRIGVPYIDVTDSVATKLVVMTQEGAERVALFRDGELSISLPQAEFAQFERVLMDAPRETRGNLFPFSVITEPPVIQFEMDNERVVGFGLPA
jgi:hypothetical protein